MVSLALERRLKRVEEVMNEDYSRCGGVGGDGRGWLVLCLCGMLVGRMGALAS
jgi:hypothetical protein